MKIRKDDNVKIAIGKDRGKTGKVLKVISRESKVVVEGINIYKRHLRKMAGQEGKIVEIIKPIDISNVSLICPSCKAITRVGFKIENNNKNRFCKKCNKII